MLLLCEETEIEVHEIERGGEKGREREGGKVCCGYPWRASLLSLHTLPKETSKSLGKTHQKEAGRTTLTDCTGLAGAICVPAYQGGKAL